MTSHSRIVNRILHAVSELWQPLLLAGLAAMVTLSFGFDFAVENHNQYLLEAIRKLEPGTFERDWFTTQTTQYHGNFSRLLVLLAALGPLDWMLTLLNATLVGGSVLLVYRMVVHLEPAAALWVTAALAGLFIVGQTESFAVTYLQRSYAQPSGIASFLWLLAAERFIAGRMFASGLALAAAGFIHLNYLVLGTLAFGLAQLCLGGTFAELFKRAIAQFWLVLLVLIASLPTLLAASGSGAEVDSARHIYFHYRVPHHYLPQQYWPEMIPFIGWMLLGWVGASGALRGSEPGRRWVVLFGSGLAVIALLHQLTTWVFVPPVALLFVSRLAPLVQVLAQGIVLIMLYRAFAGTGPTSRPTGLTRSGAVWVAIGTLVVALGLDFAGIPSRKERPDWLLIALAVPLSLGAAVLLARSGSPRWRAAAGPSAIAIVVLAVTAVALHSGLYRFRHSTMVRGPAGAAAQELYAWARSKPPDTLFVVPPMLQDFRVQSRRAVVVDWKSVPGLPLELLEWHRRLQDETGLDQVRSPTAAEAGYRAMSAERAYTLVARYGAAYAIFRVGPHGSAPEWCDESFGNPQYIACRLSSP